MSFFAKMREQILENIKDWRSDSFMPRRRLSLGDIRDLLLPCIYGERGRHPEIEFSIRIDKATKTLLITGYNLKTKNYLGFALTKEELESGRYKTSFMPSLHKLTELLSGPKEMAL
jgi:hypothetical protein